jgi:hypothetical protein
MFTGFALWQQIALVALALLSLVYVFYFKIWVALAIASDLLFVSALAVCLASVAAPPLFDGGARFIVDSSPLPEALAEADARVKELETLPSRLIARALEKVGYEPDPEPDVGTAESIDMEPEPQRIPGPFESRVRPTVDSLVGGVLRVASGTAAFLLLLLALALRSSTATARELRALGIRLDALEALEPQSATA